MRYKGFLKLRKKVFYLIIMISNFVNICLSQRNCNLDYEWQCDNGDCIELANKCDGILNCKDNSDEIAEHCIGQSNCPSYLYRCVYGACISKNMLCNTNWDCADGSDELASICSPNTTISLQGTCSFRNQYQCLSGECIDISDLCDGRKDCADESDEVIHVCASRICPTYAFRCGYGGCIASNKKCDGFKSCVDGSDEASSLCGYPRKPIKSPSRQNSTSFVSNKKSAKCKLINQTNLLIKDLNGWLSSSNEVEINTILEFSCQTGFFLEGDKVAICTSQGWNVLFPKCTKFCNRNSIVLGISTRARCTYQGTAVNCDDRIRPQTKAHITCAYGFQQDPTSEFSETLHCLENGEWDAQKGFCIMKCGQVLQKVTKFSTGGISVDITVAPWQIAVYSSYNDDKLIYKCGGSIISPSLVISAAHCFWDERNSGLINNSQFLIAAGRTYQNLKRREPNEEFRNISRLFIHTNYRDLENNYEYDLAVIVLDKSLPFSYSIYPLCNPRLDNAQQYVESNMTGWFAGWGITEDGLTASTLQSVGTNTLSFRDCQKEVKRREPNYVLPSDKFCLFDFMGQRSACKGDSGSGFVMVQTSEQTQTFRLVGVISHTPIRRRDCAEDGLVTATNVQFMRDLIQSSLKIARAVDAKYEPIANEK